jgi:hypothetical protein
MLWSQRGQQQVIRPGEIIVWHGRQSLAFRMPERFRKLCLATDHTGEGAGPPALPFDRLVYTENLNSDVVVDVQQESRVNK